MRKVAYIHPENQAYIARMQAAGISKAQLAEEIGICQTTLWHWFHFPLDRVRRWRIETALAELGGGECK